MSASLTTLISRVQAQLIDDGTRFSTATTTAALRAILTAANQRVPIHAAERITVIADQKEYELSDADSRAVSILEVLEWDDDGEDHTPIPFDTYQEDERVFFRLRVPLQAGEILVRYTIPHTIQGLDDATSSTAPSILDQILVDGACANALAFRAASRVETINLQKEVSDNYREAMDSFRNAYEQGMRAYERSRRPAVSEPNRDAWNDQYHNWRL